MKHHHILMQQNLERMAATGKLYRSEFPGSKLWQVYLNNFSPDPVFRDPESSVHNCNLCNNFIRRYGNIVAIENGKIITLWDVEKGELDESEYSSSFQAMSMILREVPIENVFFETFQELNSLNYEKTRKSATHHQLGIAENHKQYNKEEAEKYGVVTEGETRKFDHLHIQLPAQFVDMSGKSIESIMGEYRDAKNVFQRAMEEIPLDTLNLVRDLINQGSLLDGQTHLYKLEQFIPFKQEYNIILTAERDNWCWTKSYKLPIAKFKNELIGVLCSELAEGKELNAACQAWNKRVDPANYMKATAPITKKQIEEAKKFVEENGFEESFNRRFAVIEDIKVGEIHHANAGSGKIASVSIFDGVKSTSTRHKRSEFDGIETVSIENFMQKILPTCTSVEAFLTNNMEGNMVSLTTAKDKESKPIFKWNNNFSWTFNGNLAGKSQLAEMVEAKGGRTDGVFRFTHSWNELEPNQSLMDLHVFMPGNDHEGGVHDMYGNRERVGWNNRTHIPSGGVQDVDYTAQAPVGYIPVENITFPSLSKMPDGKYICQIHNWHFRVSGGRGKAEIAFGGNVFQYVYPATKNKQWITVAEVTLKNGQFTIEHKLPLANEITKDIYGLETNQFHKVNLVCLSPNHWEGNNVGNKHYFFMLEGAKCPISIRSFHNENLVPELATHRKVLEVLGANTMIAPEGKQLSGLGFNHTVTDSVILKLSGTHKRTIRVTFGNG